MHCLYAERIRQSPSINGREIQEENFLRRATSILWTGAISWYMVERAAAVGCVLQVPNVVMGVTVLAAGTSIPDCMASLVVARQGLGDMAIANAIGSNIFDIWLGLGAPYMIILLIQKRTLEMDRGGLVTSILIWLAVLVVYISCIVVARWHITPPVGYVLITIYVAFAIYNVAVWLQAK
jgi:Ca2+/Na+ antiporter